MFSHVVLGANDLARMIAFYDAVLTPLGLVRRPDPDGSPGACWDIPGTPLPQLFIGAPFDGRPATAGNGVMVAFTATEPTLVDRAHAAGLMAGGSDEGAPGQRPQYGAGYYGAYLRDPEGNKLHVVVRGDIGR